MIYNDKHTRISYEKNQVKYQKETSERNLRREKERDFKKFVSRFYKFLERDWWDSVSIADKKTLYSNWKYIKNMCHVHNIKEEYSFKDFAEKARLNIKPNITVYRDKKINKILQ